VPKSRVRRKSPFVPPPTPEQAKAKLPKRWVAPLMVTLFLVGLAWIVVYYIGGQDISWMVTLGSWNLIIGFALLGGGFACATRWR
jgi:Cell division protein CrgA